MITLHISNGKTSVAHHFTNEKKPVEFFSISQNFNLTHCISFKSNNNEITNIFLNDISDLYDIKYTIDEFLIDESKSGSNA